MEKYDGMPPLEEAEPSESRRGAGGKVRRQSNRRSRITPYSRPQPNLSQAPSADAGGGWLSMLVTPARRLISSGAARILPALWSPAVESPALYSDEDHESEQDEVEHLGEDEIRRENPDATCSLSHQIRDAKIVESGLSGAAPLDGVKDDKARDMPDNDGLSEIEKMIRGKSFSRDEVERLMEILNSKKKDSTKLDGPKVQSIMVGVEIPRSAMAPIFPNKSKEENQERFDQQRQEFQTPLPKSKLRSDIGASPIDIARAYMGSRAVDIGSSSISKTFEEDKAFMHVGPSNSNIPSPSSKPEQFSTPQTQRGRYDFNFRRTPYSRTVNSVSKFKLNQLRDGPTNSLNITSTPLQQPSTTISGQVKESSIKAFDSHYASGGPIRRSRHQLTPASSRKSVKFSPLQPSHLHQEKADVAIHSLPPFRRNADPIGTSVLKPQTVEGTPQSVWFKASNVHTHSSQMAKKILEHLDRTVPTPKDMSAEFKLSNSEGKPSSSDVISIENGPDSQVGAGKNTTKHLDVERTPLSFQDPPAEDTVKGKSSTSDAGFFFTVPKGNTDATKKTYENVPKFAPTSSNSQSQHPWKKPPTAIPAQKTVLPFISITKAPIKPTLAPDNNPLGFTFQVSASPSSFPDPPTPSLMLPPSLNGNSDIPAFSFGLKSSSTSPPLVFSFPSDSVFTDAFSDIKFSFGGSEKVPIDFSSVKKDTVCC